MKRPARRGAAAVAVVLIAITSTSCGDGDDHVPAATKSTVPPMTQLLHLDFDGATISRDRVTVSNGGRLAVQTRLATAAGGRAVISPRRDGREALRLPRISDAANPPRAVVLVLPDPAVDTSVGQLGPDNRDFTFGGTFELDRLSEGNSLDNGNNLVQRGLSGDPAQYKLQVDHAHVSCRIAGSDGAVEVKSRARVKPGEWYSATCSRVGRMITLALRGANGTTDRVSEAGKTGQIIAGPGTPFAIGGKATYDGRAVEGDSDQFNGEVGEVFLDMRLEG